MNGQAWRDFFITVFLLGTSFLIAMLSSVAAEQGQGRLGAIAAALSLLLALIGAIYIIPRLARNIRMEFIRFAVRTTVTVEGLFFVVFLVIIAFAAWNTGNNLLYLILSAMLAFLVAGNLIARATLADLAVQLRFPDHIFAGEPANLNVTLINHKRWMPSYSVTVEALAETDEDGGKKKRAEERESASAEAGRRFAATPQAGLGKLAYFVLTPAGTSARQRVEFTFGRRGRYPITGFNLSTKFPAGFFKKWRRIDANGEILVYPKPQPLDDFYHTLPMLAGQIRSHSRGSGDDLYAIRPYQPSDHMRHIDWKATAKLSRLMVREYTREDEWRLTIVFDTARPAELRSDPEKAKGKSRRGKKTDKDGKKVEAEASALFAARFERAVIQAASLAHHFILEHADVELITPNRKHNVASGSGHEHLNKILRSLATLEPDGPPPASAENGKPTPPGRAAAAKTNGGIAWRLLDEVPVLADDRRFKVLITSAKKGTIPAHIWRSAHVIFMEDL